MLHERLNGRDKRHQSVETRKQHTRAAACQALATACLGTTSTHPAMLSGGDSSGRACALSALAATASPQPAACASMRSAATKCTEESIRKPPGQPAVSLRHWLTKYLRCSACLSCTALQSYKAGRAGMCSAAHASVARAGSTCAGIRGWWCVSVPWRSWCLLAWRVTSMPGAPLRQPCTAWLLHLWVIWT
jgi:hypothetical protein